MNCGSVSMDELKGWHTYYGHGACCGIPASVNGYDVAMPHDDVQTNRWCTTEYNSNNSWNTNFNNGNFNNNNKNNQFKVRPVAASDTPSEFILSVVAAFEDCCENKRTSPECISYTEHAVEDIPVLAHELYTGEYQPGPSTCFLVKYPKYREVFAACFRDRIVHHWLYLQLNPYFERRFNTQSNVTFNCRVGYGTLAAQHALYEAIKKQTYNYQRQAWIYRGDLVSFFMSIDKRRLWNKLEVFIKKEYKGHFVKQVLDITHTVVFHRPEENCMFNTNPNEWARHISTDKSLFTSGEYFGMPIGNLTTQIFANFYMSWFDDYAQQFFRRREIDAHYIRFVDDFVVVCRSKPLLKVFVREAAEWLKGMLGVTLHTDKHHFQTAGKGVKFVGAYLKNHRIYLSNRTIARMTERVHGFNRMLTHKENITLADTNRILQVLNSYLGFCKGKRTYRIRKQLLQQFNQRFYDYFYIKGHYESIKAKRSVSALY